jgi:hypothetical protein
MILTAFKQHTEMKKGKEAKEYLPTYLPQRNYLQEDKTLAGKRNQQDCFLIIIRGPKLRSEWRYHFRRGVNQGEQRREEVEGNK